MIVGAPKSGTSSLLAYLDQHPGIQGQNCPEMHWFLDPELHRSPFPESLYFAADGGDSRVRMGKLARLMYDAGAVERLRRLNADVQAVAILREPVARAYSAYWFRRRRGAESAETFEQILDGPPEASRFYVDWGRYAPHLERLRSILGAAAVHILILEELVDDPQGAVAPLLGRLGLDLSPLPAEVPRDNAGRTSRSGRLGWARRQPVVRTLVSHVPARARQAGRERYRRMNEPEQAPPPMALATRRRLDAAFEAPNRRLEELLGRPIPAWRRDASD